MEYDENSDAGSLAIAVVGMAGRFPGAQNLEEFWRNLCEGRETISFFDDNELSPSVDTKLRSNPDYVKARGIIADVDKFDAAFFGVSPREAEVMDPQNRVFLETAWAALEDAGCDPAQLEGLVGVYAGMANNTYLPNCVQYRTDLIRALGEFNVMLANEKDFLATRVSHKLNLHGPSISMYTGCSTSLVAICQAYHGLMSFQCDVALAGGVAITVPQNVGYLPFDGGIQSSDGHCRPFDRNATGTVFSDGVGVVVLKRLDEARADGDRIDAVIRGAALNNDGADKISFAAPSVEGQSSAVAMAIGQADVNPETISYVETHGTGTHLGDPIEIEALTRAFRHGTDKKGYCAIGSLKSNVGHLLAAAGVSGFIKTVLALKYKKLPPSLHYESPNPEIDFANSPFYVQTELVDWPEGSTPRRAGVSSFGIGGTNAHLILEEGPSAPAASESHPTPAHLLTISAKTEEALDVATVNLASFLEINSDVCMSDVAYTLHCGRKSFAYRRAITCSSIQDAVSKLANPSERSVFNGVLDEGVSPEVVFLFPGQGAQYKEMGRTLYQSETVFREAFDRCAALFESFTGWSLTESLYGVRKSELSLADANVWQPAIFSVSFALAKMIESWGVNPTTMVGHSVGELVAATLAGVFSLEDAVRFLADRGEILNEADEGRMLSVMLGEEDLNNRLPGNLVVAAVNTESLCVVAGPVDEVSAFERQLELDNVVCRRLESSYAFHSPMMNASAGALIARMGSVQLSMPSIPMISCTTGELINEQLAIDPAYWANQMSQTVRFSDALQSLNNGSPKVFVEVGPGVQTATFARQHFRNTRVANVVSLLGESVETEWQNLMQSLAQIWLTSDSLDWRAFHAHKRRQKVGLPTYPFARQRYWADSKPPQNDVGPANAIAKTENTAGGGRAYTTESKSSPVSDTSTANELKDRVDARSRRRHRARERTDDSSNN